MTHIGRVRDIVRYPVKSMAGMPAESASLGWHGLAGDRRWAFRRLGDRGGFPWLTAGRLPSLVTYQPVWQPPGLPGRASGGAGEIGERACTHVRTPTGDLLDLDSPVLTAEIADRFGHPVELMQMKHGIFDEGAVSVISPATMAAIGRDAGLEVDPRRFRANLVVDTEDDGSFNEDAWVGKVLVFGDPDVGPVVSVTLRDERCLMINLDPDTAQQDGRVMQAVARLNENTAGVYATVVRCGTVRVGDRVSIASA